MDVDDILGEIFNHLPCPDLIRLRRVSSRWNRLITKKYDLDSFRIDQNNRFILDGRNCGECILSSFNKAWMRDIKSYMLQDYNQLISDNETQLQITLCIDNKNPHLTSRIVFNFYELSIRHNQKHIVKSTNRVLRYFIVVSLWNKIEYKIL